jgi:serine O-acetyltransferase
MTKNNQGSRNYPIRFMASTYSRIRGDIVSVFERDPAARSFLEVLLCYPGLYAVWSYRLAHWFWVHNLKLLGRCISQITRFLTGIEIHPGARLGPNLFIDHGMGVVIGETAEIGADVTLYHGVTLGGTSSDKKKRHPTIGNRVVIGAGAKILGAIIIGDDTRIGANAVVVQSAPENTVVVGVPGKNFVRTESPRLRSEPDLNHTDMPDLIGISLKLLAERVEILENQIDEKKTAKTILKISEINTYQNDDFSI